VLTIVFMLIVAQPRRRSTNRDHSSKGERAQSYAPPTPT
jgi:hypothetical protein